MTVIINNTDKGTLIILIALLLGISYISYGPLAAYLVEMFPLKICYTSLSFPYHIGNGIFGGMALVIATYLVSKAKEAHSEDYYMAGLTYPILLMSISFVVGLFYLREYKDIGPSPKIQSTISKKLKRILGIVWILLGIAAAYFGIFELGLPKLSGRQDDLIFGIILTAIITPIVTVGLFLLGKYSLQGEYDE